MLEAVGVSVGVGVGVVVGGEARPKGSAVAVVGGGVWRYRGVEEESTRSAPCVCRKIPLGTSARVSLPNRPERP